MTIDRPGGVKRKRAEIGQGYKDGDNYDDDDDNDDDLTAAVTRLYRRFILPLEESKSSLSRYRQALRRDDQMFNRRGPIRDLVILNSSIDLGAQQVQEAWNAIVPRVPQLWRLIPAASREDALSVAIQNESTALGMLAALNKSVEAWVGAIATRPSGQDHPDTDTNTSTSTNNKISRQNPHSLPHLTLGTVSLGRNLLLSALGQLDKLVKNLASSFRLETGDKEAPGPSSSPTIHTHDMSAVDLFSYHPDLMQLCMQTVSDNWAHNKQKSSHRTTLPTPTSIRGRSTDTHRLAGETRERRPRIVLAPICVLSSGRDADDEEEDGDETDDIQGDGWARFCHEYNRSRPTPDGTGRASGNEINRDESRDRRPEIIFACFGTARRPTTSPVNATWDWWVVSCDTRTRTVSIYAHHSPGLPSIEPLLKTRLNKLDPVTTKSSLGGWTFKTVTLMAPKSADLASGPIAILVLGLAIAPRALDDADIHSETGGVSRRALMSALTSSNPRLGVLGPGQSPETLTQLSRRLALVQMIDLAVLRERTCQVWDAAREGLFTKQQDRGHGT